MKQKVILLDLCPKIYSAFLCFLAPDSAHTCSDLACIALLVSVIPIIPAERASLEALWES